MAKATKAQKNEVIKAVMYDQKASIADEFGQMQAFLMTRYGLWFKATDQDVVVSMKNGKVVTDQSLGLNFIEYGDVHFTNEAGDVLQESDVANLINPNTRYNVVDYIKVEKPA